MASRIELEASYHLGENYEDILEKIKEQNFKLVEDSVEEDTYFTDKNLEFVKSRTCLRTRKTNEDFLELTYKPKTDNSTEKYGKKEVNLRLDPKDYEDTKCRRLQPLCRAHRPPYAGQCHRLRGSVPRPSQPEKLQRVRNLLSR